MMIEKFTKYRTSDGQEHYSMAMAKQHVANEELRKSLNECWNIMAEAQDVLNFLSSRRVQVRAWLDLCDAMEKESLT